MRAWTGIEIREEQERLERESATLLGYMLFEYSRLDVELGLLLAWADDGRDLHAARERLSNDNFHSKLAALQKAVRAKFADAPATVAAYETWMHDAHQLRELRNKLFHGRWGVEAIQQEVVCVTGLPGSSKDEKTRYSVAHLQGWLESMRSLRRRLHELTKHKRL